MGAFVGTRAARKCRRRPQGFTERSQPPNFQEFLKKKKKRKEKKEEEKERNILNVVTPFFHCFVSKKTKEGKGAGEGEQEGRLFGREEAVLLNHGEEMKSLGESIAFCLSVCKYTNNKEVIPTLFLFLFYFFKFFFGFVFR